MKRIWIGTVAAIAAAVTAVLLLATRGAAATASGDARDGVRTSFEHSVVGFGDRVHARVVVLADRSALDTSKLHVTEDVAPLTALGPARVTRTVRGRLLVVSYELPAVCVTEQCLAKRRSQARRAARDARAAAAASQGEVAWPVLEVRGRVVAADLAPTQPPLRSDTTPPRVDYRIAPSTLARCSSCSPRPCSPSPAVALAGRQLAASCAPRAATEPR